MHSISIWSNTLYKSCSKRCKTVKLCLTILGRYALKDEVGVYLVTAELFHVPGNCNESVINQIDSIVASRSQEGRKRILGGKLSFSNIFNLMEIHVYFSDK